MSDKQLRFFAIFLCVCLSIALFFDGYLYFKNVGKSPQEEHHSTFFSFVFGPTMQNITKGNLYLNLTFDTVESNLTVKAEINADSYNPDAVLALQFDSDNNGTIDIPYLPELDYYHYSFKDNDLQFLLRVNNKTTPSTSLYWGWLPNGTIYFSGALPMLYPRLLESPFHMCVYKDGVYTFSFTFPVVPTIFDLNWPYGWLCGEYAVQGKLVRVLYSIEPSVVEVPEEGMAVYVPPFKFTE